MLFKKCVPLLCYAVFCGLVYHTEGQNCEQRLSNLANDYKIGYGLINMSINCLENNIDFTRSSLLEWYQLELNCSRKSTSENVVFKNVGQFISLDGDRIIVNVSEISFSNDPTIECIIEGCGTIITTIGGYVKIPATTIDCSFTNKIVINKDALVVNNTLAILWEPLPMKYGGIYLINYLVKITSASLLQEYSEKLSRSETASVWETSITSFEYPFDLQPFTRYTVQVFAELNYYIPEIQITPPATVITPESIPSEPQKFTALPSFKDVTLKWEKPEHPNGIITSYKVAQTDDSSGESIEFNTPNTMFIIKRLSPGKDYLFRVSAFTGAGEGPTAIVNVTTTTGVIPPVINEVMEIRENVVSIIIEPFSTELGPLSHSFVIVMKGSVSHGASTDVDTRTLLPYTDYRWEYYGYYIAAVYDASNDDPIILIGDNSTTEYEDIKYMNGPLEKGVELSFFIRLFSKTSPNVYKDSLLTSSATISILDDTNSKPSSSEPSKAERFSFCIFILLIFTSASVYTNISP